MLDKLKQQLKSTGRIVFTIRVHANAKKTGIKSVMSDGSIKLDIAAPAVDNKANREIIKLFADEFGVGTGCVRIVSGQTSRIKTLDIKVPSSKSQVPNKFQGSNHK